MSSSPAQCTMFVFGQRPDPPSPGRDARDTSTHHCCCPSCTVSGQQCQGGREGACQVLCCSCTCGASAPTEVFMQHGSSSSSSGQAELLPRSLLCCVVPPPSLGSPHLSPGGMLFGPDSSSSGYISSAFSPTSGSMRLPSWCSSAGGASAGGSHSWSAAPSWAAVDATVLSFSDSASSSSGGALSCTSTAGSMGALAGWQQGGNAAPPVLRAAAATGTAPALGGSQVLPAAARHVPAGSLATAEGPARKAARARQAPAPAQGDGGQACIVQAAEDNTPWLLHLPFGLLQRIAQHLLLDAPASSTGGSCCKDTITAPAPAGSNSSKPASSSSKGGASGDSCSGGSTRSSAAAAASALQELSCTCMLLRQVVLATLPRLHLQLHQLQDLAACQHTLSSVAVLTVEVKPQSNPGQPFSQLSKAAAGQDSQKQQQQKPSSKGTPEEAATSSQQVPYAQLQESLPLALMRLPYVRHVVLQGMRSSLVPLLQPLQLLPHLQEVTLQGRRGRMALLPAALAHARDAAARSAQQAAKQQAAAVSAQEALAAQQAAARQEAAQRAAAAAAQQAAAAQPPAAAPSSYRDALLARQAKSSSSSSSKGNNTGTSSSHTSATATTNSSSSSGDGSGGRGNAATSSSSSSSRGSSSIFSRAGWHKVKATANSITYSFGLGAPNTHTRAPASSSSRSGSTKSSSSAGSGGSGSSKDTVCQAGAQTTLALPGPRPPVLPLHDLSCLRKLTLRRLNLCSIRYSSGGGGSSSSFCPLSLLAQHLTRLQCLSMQQVALDSASLASLAGAPLQAGSPRRPHTALPSTLQELSLSCIKQPRLELHHISVLTALSALHLANLSVQSGLNSSSSNGGGSNGGGGGVLVWHDSDSDSDDEGDAGGDLQQQEQQQQQYGWENNPLVLQLLSGGLPAVGAAEQQQQQQQGSAGQQSVQEERHLGRALAHLTNLSLLTVNRVPTLIANSSIGGGTDGSIGSVGSSSEMLPDALASLRALRQLCVPLLLRDTQLPGAWGSWSTGLVSLQVTTLKLTNHWAPLAPLAALRHLTVSNLLQAPNGFLAGFAPHLTHLSVGLVKAAEPLPASAALRGRRSGPSSGSSGRAALLPPAAATQQQQLVGLAAVTGDMQLEELVLLDCSFGCSDSTRAAGAANQQAQLHFGGLPDGADLDPPAPVEAAAAAVPAEAAAPGEGPAAAVAAAAAPPQPASAATAAAGSSGRTHWEDLAARAAAIDWEAVCVADGMAAVAAAIAAIDLDSLAAAKAAAAEAGSSSKAQDLSTMFSANPFDLLDSEATDAEAEDAEAAAEDEAAGAAEPDAAAGAHEAAAPAAAGAAAAAAAAVVPPAVGIGGVLGGSQDSGSGSDAVMVPCAADVRSLMLDCRGVRKLHLERLDVGCSLVDQLPRVLYYWNRLTDLRLHHVVNTFGDAALLTLVEHHASSLQHLSLVACRGVTWAGVEGLKVASGLRSLRLAQLYPVTITAVLEAVRGMSHLTSLEAEALSAGWSATKVVDNKPLADHLRTTFEVGSYWATYTATRDGDLREGSPPAITQTAPYFKAAGGFNPDYWEFYVGPADEAAVLAAAPQLKHVAVRG